MNITPMDMQVVIPKVTEVGKGQQQRDHQNVAQQQHGAVQFQQNADRKLRQVQNSEKSEGKKVKEDGQRGKRQDAQGGGQRRESGGDAPEEEARMAVDSFRGRNIDIKM